VWCAVALGVFSRPRRRPAPSHRREGHPPRDAILGSVSFAHARHVLRGVGATVTEATNAGSTPCYTLAGIPSPLDAVQAAIVAERRK
jgi:hypothetical protein